MSSQAQLMAIKNQLETDTTTESYIGVMNILGSVTTLNETELDLSSTSQPAFVDDDIATLEESMDPTEQRYGFTFEIADSFKPENTINAEESICRTIRAKDNGDTLTEECDTVGETSGESNALGTLIHSNSKNVECSVIVEKSTIDGSEVESRFTVNPRFDPTVRIKQTYDNTFTGDSKVQKVKLMSSAKISDVTAEETERVNLLTSKKFTTYANESNKENYVNTTDSDRSNIVQPELQTISLGKSDAERKGQCLDSKEKETKGSRFMVDTMHRDIPAPSKQENTQRKYPIIFISSKPKN